MRPSKVMGTPYFSRMDFNAIMTKYFSPTLVELPETTDNLSWYWMTDQWIFLQYLNWFSTSNQFIIQSIIDNAAASLVKMLGLRIGNLWAERIRYYLYQHESRWRSLIANLNLIFEPTYFINGERFNGYDASRRCQFFIDRDMLNILNKETILQMHAELKSFKETESRFNPVFTIEKYRVTVFTDVYVPFLSEYFLYHSFVVLGYALTSHSQKP